MCFIFRCVEKFSREFDRKFRLLEPASLPVSSFKCFGLPTTDSGRQLSRILTNHQQYTCLFRVSYRDHKNNCVENNGGHDKDFERFGVHNLPHFINTSIFILWHVTLSWLGCHGELNTISLKYEIQIST